MKHSEVLAKYLVLPEGRFSIQPDKHKLTDIFTTNHYLKLKNMTKDI